MDKLTPTMFLNPETPGLAEALAELETIRIKYSEINELGTVFQEVDKMKSDRISRSLKRMVLNPPSETPGD